MERRRLRDLTLTGARLGARQGAFVVGAVLAAIALLGMLAEAHKVSYKDWHSSIGETHGVPLLLASALVALNIVVVRRRQMMVGIVCGMLVTIISFVALVGMALTHILSSVSYNAAGNVALLSLAVVMTVGLIGTVIEIVARVLERKQLEDADPEFPAARVVS